MDALEKQIPLHPPAKGGGNTYESSSAVPLPACKEEPRCARAGCWRIGFTLAVLAGLTVSVNLVNQYLAGSWRHWLFLVESLVLCCLKPASSGLKPGKVEHWRGRIIPLAIVWVVPPLLVLTVLARLPHTPFHGMPADYWLVSSVAQELFFCGFVYGWLSAVWGDPAKDLRGAWAWPMLLTPLMFSSSHWTNCEVLSARFLAFQIVYTFLGGWWSLNLRRWTGSIWLNVAQHVTVNLLASIV